MPHLPFRRKKLSAEASHSRGPSDSQSLAESPPNDLWDRAYELLREDENSKQVIQAYEKILLSELEEGNDSPTISAGLGTSRREGQMSALVQKKLKAVDDAQWKFFPGDKTVEVKAQLDRIVKAVLFAKDFVSSAVGTEPHAALAWAGVCMLLPLLLHPTIQQKALMEGLDYISSLIVRFTVIERVYRQQETEPSAVLSTGGLTELNTLFERQVTKLYSQILGYQAQVVCQLRRSTIVRFGRDVLKADDWAALLADIKNSEIACQYTSQVVHSERLDTALKEQDRRMREFFSMQEKHYHSLRQTVQTSFTAFDQAGNSNRTQTDEEAACLQALRTSTYEDHKDRNPRRVPGTCRWFLENDKYDRWREEPCSSLLWVTADPGCGKSVLAKSLVDCELRSATSHVTCYFFFKDESPEQRSPTNAVCALLHQLCRQNHILLQKIMDAYRNDGRRLIQSLSSLWRLLVEIAQCPEAGKVICVLDALDECEENGKQALIKSLNSFYGTQGQSNCQLKFLVTSRPYYDIEELFDEFTIRLAGEDESELIKKEIDLVIVDSVAQLASRKKFDHKTQMFLQDRLLRTENRTYLWLYLTLAGVEKGFGIGTPKRMEEYIEKMPNTIYDAYEAMLDRSPHPGRAMKLLHIVVAALRPLSLREMNMALNIEACHQSREEVDLDSEVAFRTYIKNLCGLLVSIHDSKVYLLHQTAKDFLVLQQGPSTAKPQLGHKSWKFSLDPLDSHLVLAKACLRYLSFSMFETEPMVIKSDYIYATERLSYIREHEFIDYAAQYWTWHFSISKEDDETSQSWLYLCDTHSKRFHTWYNIYRATRPSVRPVSKAEPLNLACYFGHNSIVEQLIRQGADIESKDGSGRTPLSAAAGKGHEALVRVLIKRGADTNSEDMHRRTPLWWAAEGGHEVVIEMLLDAKSFVDARDFKGQTPLSAASSAAHERAVEKLIKMGALVNTVSSEGSTPLTRTIEHRREAGETLSLSRMLLDAGADPNMTGRRRTPLIAVASDFAPAWKDPTPTELVKLLMERRASPSIMDWEGRTPLDIVRQRNDVQTAEAFERLVNTETRLSFNADASG